MVSWTLVVVGSVCAWALLAPSALACWPDCLPVQADSAREHRPAEKPGNGGGNGNGNVARPLCWPDCGNLFPP